MERVLGSLQVAALLVSASFGLGMLFGSGELALAHGMAGSIYGVATAFGMLVLALIARRLWALGLPVWGLIGRVYGPRLQGAVALLSLLWMAGVLAAQIHGGVAVLRLLGLGAVSSQLVLLALIFGASRLDLRMASKVFAACLLLSALVLLYALVEADGWGLYIHSVPVFLHDLPTFSASRVAAIVSAVSLLACMGADYQQFVVAARRPGSAVLGCVLAGLFILAIGFLPSAVVVALQKAGSLEQITDAKQVLPLVLGQVAGSMARGADSVLLVAMSLSALGSGSAILRAMTSALACAVPGNRLNGDAGLSLLALGVGAALAWRDQGIVATMVSVNVVFIASVGPCFAAILSGMPMPPGFARWSMASGFAVSTAVYLAGWWGWFGEQADVVSLVLGGLASSAVWLCACGAALRWNGKFFGLRR